MSRVYTAQNIIDRVRSLTDKQNDQSVTDQEILSFIDHNYPRTWALLAEASPPEYMVKSVQFTTVAGTIPYQVVGAGGVVTDNDFWKVKTVYVVENTNQGGELRPLEPINEFNRLWYRSPQGAWTVQLDYIRQCPNVTSLNQNIDGINGWEEHLIALVCQDVKMKLEEDAKQYQKKEMQIAEEIKKLAYRDSGYAERIVRRRHHDPYFLYRNNLDGYRLKGDNLELYYRSGFRAVP